MKDSNVILNKINNIEGDNSIKVINSCLFVVKDLDLFIKNLTDKGLSVNCGPQPLRGQFNSINNFLTCLDMDFIKCLYNHNGYHVRAGNIDKKYYLSKDKFSFKNIHMRLGSVHYYSTRVKPVESTTPNSVKQNKQLLTRSIFKDFRIFLDNNPINGDTQKKIESFILSQYN